MPAATCSDSEFIALFNQLGSPSLVAQKLKISTRSVQSRRKRIENVYDIELQTTVDMSTRNKSYYAKHAGRFNLTIENGVVIVFSDAHWWNQPLTTANRALLYLCKKLKPVAVINNGDAFDGATISRFPRPFFDEKKPTVAEELECVKDRLSEITKAAKGAKYIWCLGNHCMRMEQRLAQMVPQYEGIHGFHLKDHFPEWFPAWSTWINDNVEIRHRYKGGTHAAYNNVMANHHTTITGHLHSLKVTPYTDGKGTTKYGVDTGTLAEPLAPQFSDYLEGRHAPWRSGFVVLTFVNGVLLWPELVSKFDEDHAQFRGELIKV